MRLMLIQSGLEHLLQQFLRPAGGAQTGAKGNQGNHIQKNHYGKFPQDSFDRNPCNTRKVAARPVRKLAGRKERFNRILEGT